jgi:hypothetical protein
MEKCTKKPDAGDRVVGTLEAEQDGLPGTEGLELLLTTGPPEVDLVDIGPRGEELVPLVVRVGDEAPHPSPRPPDESVRSAIPSYGIPLRRARAPPGAGGEQEPQSLTKAREFVRPWFHDGPTVISVQAATGRTVGLSPNGYMAYRTTPSSPARAGSHRGFPVSGRAR